jgi:hypothetical protein
MASVFDDGRRGDPDHVGARDTPSARRKSAFHGDVEERA